MTSETNFYFLASSDGNVQTIRLIYMINRLQTPSVFVNQVSLLKRAFNHISLTARMK